MINLNNYFFVVFVNGLDINNYRLT